MLSKELLAAWISRITNTVFVTVGVIILVTPDPSDPALIAVGCGVAFAVPLSNIDLAGQGLRIIKIVISLIAVGLAIIMFMQSRNIEGLFIVVTAMTGIISALEVNSWK